MGPTAQEQAPPQARFAAVIDVPLPAVDAATRNHQYAAVVNFEIVPRQNVHDLLVSAAPDFTASAEYARLTPEDRAGDYIVCGAFRGYINRLANDPQSANSQEATDAFAAVEMLANSDDIEVQNALVVEVFHYLDLAGPDLERFVMRLGPTARRLYDRWP